MRPAELRLRAMMRELEQCREALRNVAEDAARRRARVRATVRRAALMLVVSGLFAAGLAAAGTPVFGAGKSPSAVEHHHRASMCGPGAGSLTGATLSASGSTITASFTVAPGCDGTTVSLASYSMVSKPAEYPQTLFDSVTKMLNAGTYTLTVSLPSCYWQADLVTGSVLPEVSTGNLYGVRKAIALTGGRTLCTPTTTATTPTRSTSTANTNTATTVTTPAPAVVQTADVAVTKTASPTVAGVGQQVTYTLTATNNGPGPALGVILVDPLPAQETFVSVSDSSCTGTTVITCTFGTLAAGASRSVQVVALASSPGTATNVATVSTTSPESTTANNQATATVHIHGVFTPPPLCAQLTLHHSAIVTAQKATLIVRVRNHGAPVPGARVEVRGPGVLVVRKTNSHGRATITIRPHRIGVLRVRLLQAASCPRRLAEVGVRGPFKPPLLTG